MRIPATLLAAGAAALAVGSLTAPAHAFPNFFNNWSNLYPASQTGLNVEAGVGTSCQLCHSAPSGGNGWNAYGWAMRTHILNGLNTTAAILASEGADSDGDPSGSTNLVEIQASTQPGWRVGPQNTHFFKNGSTLPGQVAPTAILGDLDPGQIATSYCPGDGTGNGCPCLNEGNSGEGCANSTGAGGLLEASGTNSVSAANLVFSGSNLVPGQAGLYFQGNNAAGGGNGFFDGDGLRCAGGGIRRLQVRTASVLGTSFTNVNVPVKGNVLAGQTKRYQLWYRDPSASPCGGLFNLTNGLEVTWIP
jgi:hypothetical protein